MRTVMMWLTLTLVFHVGTAQGQDTVLTSSGDWSTGGNWSAGEPGASQTAGIGNGLTAQITASGETAHTLSLANAAGAGSLDVSAGDLTVSNLLVGADTGGNIGTVNQSGGTVTINLASVSSIGIGTGTGSAGIYHISGGSLVANGSGIYAEIGKRGSATFNLSGTGIVDFTNTRILSPNGSGSLHINLDGGTWKSGLAYFGTTGDTAINIEDGSFIGGVTHFGRTGYCEVNLSGGSLTTAKDSRIGTYNGSTGVVNMTGGTYSPGLITLAERTLAVAKVTVSGGSITGGGFVVLERTGVYGGDAAITIIGTNATISLNDNFILSSNTVLHLQLDGGVTEIYHSRMSNDKTIGLAGTLKIGMAPGGAMPDGPISILRTAAQSFNGETFTTVLWEDGLSGDVIYDYDNNEVRLENVIPEPVTLGLALMGLMGIFWYRRIRN